MKIYMFGGSFDPPHLAHIEIVNRLIVDCDKLYIFPAKQSPYKVNEAVKAALKCNKPAVIDVDVDPKALYSFRRDSFKHRK